MQNNELKRINSELKKLKAEKDKLVKKVSPEISDEVRALTTRTESVLSGIEQSKFVYKR